jgi:hypothetical protein
MQNPNSLILHQYPISVSTLPSPNPQPPIARPRLSTATGHRRPLGPPPATAVHQARHRPLVTQQPVSRQALYRPPYSQRHRRLPQLPPTVFSSPYAISPRAHPGPVIILSSGRALSTRAPAAAGPSPWIGEHHYEGTVVFFLGFIVYLCGEIIVASLCVKLRTLLCIS